MIELNENTDLSELTDGQIVLLAREWFASHPSSIHIEDGREYHSDSDQDMIDLWRLNFPVKKTNDAD